MATSKKPEIIIRFVHEVVDTRTATNEVSTTADPQVPSTDKVPSPTPTSKPKDKGNSLADAIGAQVVIKSGVKLLNAVGGDEAARTIAEISKYTFLGIRALSGDPTAIATLAVDLAATAIMEVRKVAVEQATVQNEVDMARAQAGLLNMNGVRMQKHFFTGRYQYSRQ